MTTTNTTTPAARYCHWRQQGTLALRLAALLDGIVQGAEVDSASPWEVDRHDVQADEALYVASLPWLWAGLTEARTTADLAALAAEADEMASDRFDAGRGWQGEVWEAVSRLLWEAAA